MLSNLVVGLTVVAGIALVIGVLVARIVLLAAAIAAYFFGYVPEPSVINGSILLAASALFGNSQIIKEKK